MAALAIVSLALSLLPVSTAQATETSDQSSLLFVVDVSGSMVGTPLAQAKEALHAGIDVLGDDQRAGLRTFSGGCGTSGQLVVPIAPGNRDELRQATNQLSAGGLTPTPDALRAAAADLPDEGNRTIVLISDGQSSCGDPCTVAQEIKDDMGVDFRVHSVGFRASSNAETELQCIADATGGEYLTATNTEELADAISEAVRSADPNECYDHFFIGVRGSGEAGGADEPSLEEYESSPPSDPVYQRTSGPLASTTGMGTPVTHAFNELHNQGEGNTRFESMHARAIRYPAIPVDINLEYTDRFQRSVKIGAENLGKELNRINNQCYNARIAIAGYSQGADVINKAMGNAYRDADVGLFSQVRDIVVIGDPSHQPFRAENVGSWHHLGASNGFGASIMAGIDDEDAVRFKDANPGLVSSICAIGDVVCDFSSMGLAEFAHTAAPHIPFFDVDSEGSHTLYLGLSMKCPAVDNAWQMTMDCAGQILSEGFGVSPVAQSDGKPTLGQVVVQTGNHFNAVLGLPGTVVNLIGRLFSEPVDVGTFEVDEHGYALVSFVVPDVPTGEHHLELQGDDGSVYRIPITVTDEHLGDEVILHTIDASEYAVDVEEPSTGSLGSSGGSSGSLGGSSGGSLFGS